MCSFFFRFLFVQQDLSRCCNIPVSCALCDPWVIFWNDVTFQGKKHNKHWLGDVLVPLLNT